MKILVTGGAGFIGSNLVEKLLREGHTVSVLDNFNDFYSVEIKHANLAAVRSSIEVHEVDITNQTALDSVMAMGKFDTVVHLAARAGVRPSIQNPELYVRTNIVGTLNLLESVRRSGVHRFIFGSSSSVYGICPHVPFAEHLPIHQTISPYAATKIAGEQLCSNYAHLHGIQSVCLRFFTVYGPRQRPDLAIHDFTRRLYAGEPIRQYGDGSTARDYTFVDDIVQGVVAAIGYDRTPFEIFNLGESETTKLSELISLLEKATGRTAVIEKLPEQAGDVPLTYADISKARKLLGYSPKTKIQAGVGLFVDWFNSKKV